MKTSILALGLATVATAAVAQDRPVLTVLTYDSFTAEWGPGPAVEKAFEETCACDLQFTAAGDGAALLARVQMEGAASERSPTASSILCRTGSSLWRNPPGVRTWSPSKTTAFS